jgi:predicted NUDIX family phosphoesterase
MEFVYVAKRYDLFDLAFPHGLVLAGSNDSAHDVSRYLSRAAKRGFFVERRWAEQDSELKQLIPYTVVASDSSVLLLRRLAAGGEPRLHGKLSIGVGGHINPRDTVSENATNGPATGSASSPATGNTPAGSNGDLLAAAALRELEEEVSLPERPEISVVGMVNDESNPVGSVHLGVVYVARLSKPEVAIRETSQLEGDFVPIDELKRIAADGESRMETWSQLLCDQLDEVI